MYYAKSLNEPSVTYFFNPLNPNDKDFINHKGEIRGILKNVSLNQDTFIPDTKLYDIIKDAQFLESESIFSLFDDGEINYNIKNTNNNNSNLVLDYFKLLIEFSNTAKKLTGNDSNFIDIYIVED